MPRKCYGVGVNDAANFVRKGNKNYQLWHSVLSRCFREELHARRPTYAEATVCDEWLYFSKFNDWADRHYVEGWVLDKDILYKFNKCYSPSTCVFVPPSINTIFSNQTEKGRVGIPKGVHPNQNNFMARYGKTYLGRFSSADEASRAYAEHRARTLTEVAYEYMKHDKSDSRVACALLELAAN